MEVKGTFSVSVPVDFCWSFLKDPRTFSQCVPGCEEILSMDEKSFECVVVQKVGIFKVRFQGTTTVVEAEAQPVHLVRTVTKGTDTRTKTLMETGLALNMRADPENSGVTLVDYALTIRVVGKLAVLGEAVMRAKIKDVSRQTITSVKASVEKGYQGEAGR
jgi:uncharacterized protein